MMLDFVAGVCFPKFPCISNESWILNVCVCVCILMNRNVRRKILRYRVKIFIITLNVWEGWQKDRYYANVGIVVVVSLVGCVASNMAIEEEICLNKLNDDKLFDSVLICCHEERLS